MRQGMMEFGVCLCTCDHAGSHVYVESENKSRQFTSSGTSKGTSKDVISQLSIQINKDSKFGLEQDIAQFQLMAPFIHLTSKVRDRAECNEHFLSLS